MRCTMFDFSMVGKTDAWLTSLRMSRPDAGLATIPTVAGLSNDRRIDEAFSANSIPLCWEAREPSRPGPDSAMAGGLPGVLRVRGA